MFKSFKKPEVRGLVIIFLILVAISIPNFILSLRRARDQVRKDDMGALQKALGEYFNTFREFPLASEDGRIVACKNPGDVITRDKYGRIVGNLVPCDWGKDKLEDLTSNGQVVFMNILPREPNYQKGSNYRYISDGQHTQILVSLEGKDEPEYDEKIIARGIYCGNLICNAGRSYGCTTDKNFELCALEEQQKQK